MLDGGKEEAGEDGSIRREYFFLFYFHHRDEPCRKEWKIERKRKLEGGGKVKKRTGHRRD